MALELATPFCSGSLLLVKTKALCRSLGAIAVAFFHGLGVAHAQGPRLPPPPASWVSPALTVAPTIVKVPAALPGDSARTMRRTHSLEGGVIGGILVGALGTQLCKLGDGSHGACYVGSFCVTGLFIGFPLGALIGRQFPKDSP